MNALATREPSARCSDAVPFGRTLTSDDRPAYLRDRLPAADVPRVVALDNAGIHAGKAARAARPGLAKLGIYLDYLPPYSPELNRIEPAFKQVRHHDGPTRSFAARADLRKAVEEGFETCRRRLQTKRNNESRLAAWGRKAVLFALAVRYVGSAGGCGLAPEWYSVLAARFLGGVAVGRASVVVPLYIAEVSPPAWRGRLVVLNQLNVVGGILLSYLSNYLIAGAAPPDTAWR